MAYRIALRMLEKIRNAEPLAGPAHDLPVKIASGDTSRSRRLQSAKEVFLLPKSFQTLRQIEEQYLGRDAGAKVQRALAADRQPVAGAQGLAINVNAAAQYRRGARALSTNDI